MKTIGIIGGMSWESSAEYYRLINQAVARRLGGFHSARTLMVSVDFAEVEALQTRGHWDAAGALLAEAAAVLERGGADCVVLATNTMHRVAPAIEAATAIPLLHIADATAEAVREAGLSRVGLLGTRYTMEQDFYRGRLESNYGLEVVVPDEPDRTMVHDVIFDELVLGTIRDESREAYRAVMTRLVERGAQAVILGCTEIGLLIGPGDASTPLFDTTRLHAERAVEWALAE
ncbi:MAG: aspartate/glutamate racemase family protein [Dehalococcoidia bacterium]